MSFSKFAIATFAVLLASPSWAASMTRTVTLPDGSSREVSTIVPEEEVKMMEAQGYRRSNALATREQAARYRDDVCALAAMPAKAREIRVQAMLAKICNSARKATAE